MANKFFYPPPADVFSEVLYIPSGTPVGILWTCNYDSLNLRVFQERSDGSYTYITLLSDVSNPAGNGSYAWVANFIEGSAGGMHFEITLASNGQSLDPFNSDLFYVGSGSAISTFFASSSTTPLASSLSSSTSMISSISSTTLGTSSSIRAETSTVVTTTGSPTSSPTSNSQNNLKLGLGLGLGLGIPFVLLIIGLLGFILNRRRKERQLAPAAAPMSELAGPSEYYKHELEVYEPTHELQGGQEVHEAPS